jgi:TPR repeat protein
MTESNIQSDKRSLRWAQRCAYRSSDPLWWANLAAYYAVGTGCRPNLDRARRWYSKSAAAGYPGAMYELGCMLLQGEGGSKNSSKAERLLCAAAEAGEIDAVKVLVHCYANGDGLPRSVSNANFYRSLYRKMRKPLKHLAPAN